MEKIININQETAFKIKILYIYFFPILNTVAVTQRSNCLCLCLNWKRLQSTNSSISCANQGFLILTRDPKDFHTWWFLVKYLPSWKWKLCRVGLLFCQMTAGMDSSKTPRKPRELQNEGCFEFPQTLHSLNSSVRFPGRAVTSGAH